MVSIMHTAKIIVYDSIAFIILLIIASYSWLIIKVRLLVIWQRSLLLFHRQVLDDLV